MIVEIEIENDDIVWNETVDFIFNGRVAGALRYEYILKDQTFCRWLILE